MTISDQGVNLAGHQINAREQAQRPVSDTYS